MCVDDGATEDDNEQEDMKSSATTMETAANTPMPAPEPVVSKENKIEPVTSHEVILQEEKEGALKFSESTYVFVYGFLLPFAILLYLATSR
eukprot:CAMPEP_0116028998 /NCGR_PEP_ID=MMETSP0321-20121206/15826_1 /TAXON_ID=163516 /ORGANISM="Leptocylindrus danicus var. danicus, Strain B650" /LENGTH=90 /DNA_ID=CAMNT_0003503187 /DNA_START=142 /DNA_END=414 /DNA_ORIENTATION=+